MTGATHILAAAAIYKFAPLETPVVLVMAFTSHFVLDAIPHYELTRKANYIFGIITGIFVLITAFLNNDFLLLIGAFLGAFPDLNTLYFKNPVLMNIHSKFHSNYKISSPWISIGFELILSIICILLLLWK